MCGRMPSMAAGEPTWQGGMGNSSIRMISIARPIQLSKPIYPNAWGMGKSRKRNVVVNTRVWRTFQQLLHFPAHAFNPTYRSGNSHLRAKERPIASRFIKLKVRVSVFTADSKSFGALESWKERQMQQRCCTFLGLFTQAKRVSNK